MDDLQEQPFSLMPMPELLRKQGGEVEDPWLTPIAFMAATGSYAVGHAVQYPELSLSVVSGRAFAAGAVVAGVYKAVEFFRGI